MKKRIAGALTIALALALGAAAARGAGADPLPASPEAPLPDVSVLAVSVDAATGSIPAGATAKGVATLTNPSSRPAQVTLDVALVGDLDENGLPQTVYAKVYGREAVTVEPGATVEAPFSLGVPAGVSADEASVEVQVRLEGSVYLGWGYSAPVKVAGQGGFATADAAFFTLADGSEVPHTAGPTLYRQEPKNRMPLSVVLRGHGAALALTPVVTEGNRAAAADLETRRLAPVSVPASGVATATIAFEHGGRAPGIYEGEVAWEDASGVERAPRVGFRYVVDGQTATVHSVSASSGIAKTGDELTVTVAISGTPIDLLAADRDRAPEAAKVKVRLVDPSGSTVAEASRTQVLPPLGEMSFALKAEHAALTMSAEVTVTGADGRELFSRQFPLVEGETAPIEDVAPAFDGVAFTATAVAAAILLAAAIVAARRGRSGASLLAVLLAAALWGFAYYSVAGANVIIASRNVNVGWIEGCTGPNIYVNNPGQTQSCNTPVVARARVQYSYCANSSNYGSSQMWLQKAGTAVLYGPTISNSYSGGGGHSAAYYDGMLALPIGPGYFSENGNYGIWVTNSGVVGGDGCSWTVTGYHPFSVTDCDQCLNIAGAQATVPSGLGRDAAGNCNVPDVCPNIAGAQNVVPSGMTTNAGGECVCNSGTTLDATTGSCVCAPGNTACAGTQNGSQSGTTCPFGKKYCGGACVSNETACDAVVVDSCPMTPDGQYCVEIFRADGTRSDQLANYTAEELQLIFGAGVSLALEEQRAAIEGGFEAAPIWGVPGRAVPGANESSAGCGGTVCSYGADSCITSVQPSGSAIGRCGPAEGTAAGSGASPDAFLEVEPAIIGRGGTCEVYWSSQAMATCQVRGEGISSTALAGRGKTPALQSSAIYALDCVGLDGRAYSDADQCVVDPNVREF